ncbi:HD-GYP domain-containing protein [Clostridium ganghwense]|uniref:HD-GYP domain-containing protein n=1 Tax=Clostridium ganghwense TaxID=312089 RepID=A0ABT4CSQ5_9CLOT|nr:HD-GYP domain-containing protein [Clostridium ganghwense]MCY6372087.1 HD-GYP domain-containing protein [Clostridium ganghwense]
MRLVPIECVKDGCYLGKTIFDNNGRVLLRDGVKLNNNIIKKIKSIGIFSIYINDEYSNVEIEDIIKPEIRQKSIKVLKESFSSLEKYNFNINPSKCKNDILKEREKYFNSISQIAEEILDELLSKKNVMINLVDIKSMDNYTYQHCVNVSVLSLVLGIQLQLKKSELLDLCIGALLHDIGKVLTPKEIINKEGPLTDEEFEIIKEHTTKGYEYLKGSLDISSTARVIVLQHHEKVNGTGYPEGRTEDRISRFSRIVAIADVYDALTSDRPYRRALSPNEAVEYILGNGQTQFDYEMVKAFAAVIIPYPEGSLVKLSTNDIGLIEKIYPFFPLRPKIKIVKSKNESKVNTSVELMHELDIVIEGVAYEV